MARPPRFVLPGVPQHVIQRGNNREPCFFSTEDYLFYLDALHEASLKFGCQVHTYVLMTNHVHLLLTPEHPYAISQVMQSIGLRYVRYINNSYRRSGTLWEGRYKASLIETERYLLTCYRYIELNPVRAKMVASPADYRWSSYQANAQGGSDKCLTPHREYLRLGEEPETCCHAYRELFRNHIDDALVHEIRHTLNKELVFGSEYFKDKIERVLKRRAREGQSARPRVEEEMGEYWVY